MVFFVIIFGITSLYILVYNPEVTANCRENPLYFVILILSFVAVANVPRLVSQKRYMMALVFSSLTISFLLILVDIQLYPTLLISAIDPLYSVTIYNAASSQKSLRIILTIVIIEVPLLATYFFFLYQTLNRKRQLDTTSY